MGGEESRADDTILDRERKLRHTLSEQRRLKLQRAKIDGEAPPEFCQTCLQEECACPPTLS